MARINHNISAPNDGLGDQLRTAFGNQNTMNTELYNNKVDKVTGKDLSANDFTNIDKAKLDAMEAGAGVQIQSDWEQNDTTQKDYIKNKPLEMFSSVGSFHYVDLATQTTPLTVLLGVEKKITNDTLSPLTNVLNAPYGISSMWDTINNQLDFTQTAIGDLVTIIPAIEITTTVANQTFSIYIKMGIGSLTPTTKQVYNGALAVVGSIIVNATRDFTIDTLDNKDYPAEIFVLSNADATVKSGDLDIKVVRKDINVVTDHAHTNLALLETFTSTLKANWDDAWSWIVTNGTNLINHLSNTSNPHSVTYTQVGAQAPLVSATNIKTINGTTILGAGDLVIGSGATNTDQLPEGTSNLYFTTARVAGKEDTSNKKLDIEANKLSDVFYAPIKPIVDWVTNFFVKGSGTANYLPKFGVGGKVLENSRFYDDGGKSSVNGANLVDDFNINGKVRLIGESIILPYTLVSEINSYAGSQSQFKCNSIKFLTGTYVDQGILTFNTSVIGVDLERFRINETGNLLVNTTSDNLTDKLQIAGSVKATSSVQVGDNTAVASAALAGATRYRADANNSYADMCMLTGIGVYSWVNILTNTF